MHSCMTVVIPTRERADVLKWTLRATLSLQYPNLRVLVSDNASTDGTREIVESFTDHRLQYVRTPERVSMRANWEFAMQHVHDGWVTVIGDDDAVLPGAIEKVFEIVRETGVQAVRARTAEYVWPNAANGTPPTITVPLSRGYEVRETREALTQVLNGTRAYTSLPVLYNGGFIRVDALKHLASKSSRIFASSIPDVYTGVALCGTLDRYAYSYAPLAINGASRHSGGTAAFKERRAGETDSMDPAKRFLQENDVPFEPRIPLQSDGTLPFALHAYVLESYFQAIHAGIALPELANFNFHDRVIIRELVDRRRIEASREWLGQFRRANGIPHNLPLRLTHTEELGRRCRNAIAKVLRLGLIATDAAPEMPLENVFDAVKFVAHVLNNPPNRLANMAKRGLNYAIPMVTKVRSRYTG